jgi:hypothetical protein
LPAHLAQGQARRENPASRGGIITDQPHRYEIRIRGRLGDTVRSAFPALKAMTRGDDTVLAGVLADQAALYGVLIECEALGLQLLDVHCLNQQNDDYEAR